MNLTATWSERLDALLPELIELRRHLHAHPELSGEEHQTAALIAGDLRQLIRQWRPELAAVEKFFFYRSSNTISVVQARGVVIMTLARFGIPIVEFPPMQIKLALAGFGHAQKDEVLEAVMRELNLTDPPRPDDAADALAAALTGWFQR